MQASLGLPCLKPSTPTDDAPRCDAGRRRRGAACTAALILLAGATLPLLRLFTVTSGGMCHIDLAQWPQVEG
jgi:hypothetical protein